MKNLITLSMAMSCMLPGFASAFTFGQAIKTIEKHPQLLTSEGRIELLREQGAQAGSWGDPKFGVAAKNFPKDDLRNDITPMTGVEYSISQTIALTNKYSKMENALRGEAKAAAMDGLYLKKAIHRELWALAIQKRSLEREIQIHKENKSWLKNMIDVSEGLYANGKVSQQAVLELQIRSSETDALISNKGHDLERNRAQLSYFLPGLPGELELNSVPWAVLDSDFSKKVAPNEKELALSEMAKSSEIELDSRKLGYVPDMTVSLGYTKRSDKVDNVGDFVSAGVFFTLPLSGKQYAAADAARAKLRVAKESLNDYRLKRKAELSNLELQIQKAQKELSILQKGSLLYAKSARDIAAKSYALGNTGYLELLQAELKYQNLRLQENTLMEKHLLGKADYLFLRGDSLNE